ncbi:MAG: GntR family transcriptional regulator [Reyranellaceae bacterium]
MSDMKISSVAAPVRQQVAASFRNAILNGRFQPGVRLIEKELCELTGASRTSVREALRQLETEGLVEVLPNKGPIVASISAKQARSLYQVRAALESLAGDLFARNATDAQMARLEAAVEEVAQAYDNGDIDLMLKAKDGFYGILLEGADNEIVPSFLGMLQARVSLLRRVSLGTPARLAASIGEIRVILAALQRRDPQAAAEACRRHVENAAEAALNQNRRTA